MGKVVRIGKPIRGLTRPLFRQDQPNPDYTPELYGNPILPFRSFASGKRSFVVEIGKRVYRIKGGALNPRGFFSEADDGILTYVEDGNTLEQAERERKYSEIYSSILAKVGLASAMKVVGFFDYGISS
jgi:hypothetical protein